MILNVTELRDGITSLHGIHELYCVWQVSIKAAQMSVFCKCMYVSLFLTENMHLEENNFRDQFGLELRSQILCHKNLCN